LSSAATNKSILRLIFRAAELKVSEPRAAVQPAAAHVARDTDDCDPRIARARAAKHHALSDRRLDSANIFREGFIDDYGL